MLVVTYYLYLGSLPLNLFLCCSFQKNQKLCADVSSSTGCGCYYGFKGGILEEGILG